MIEATPDWTEVFFDNGRFLERERFVANGGKVGGKILNLALLRAKPHARFVFCGQISQYNEKRQGS